MAVWSALRTAIFFSFGRTAAAAGRAYIPGTMPSLPTDRDHMRRALDLAARGWGQTAPNPMVGAVVVRDGQVVGEGFHSRYGEAHAEPNALRMAGERARDATLYVSLEPCAHHGQTPPCVDAILSAGISRVVIAAEDPNPVAAGGAKVLRAAGVEVHTGIEEAAARELNAPFFFSHTASRPWITLKLAVSIDGALTDARRSSAWLTGPESRAEVHRLRAGSDAVAVGVGTVMADDPLLTVRDAVAPRIPPRRVVFDDRLETPSAARLLAASGGGPVTILATRGEPRDAAARRAALEAAGAHVVVSRTIEEGLAELRREGIRSLLVEGGAGVAGRLLEAAVVDRLVIFQAPVLLGAGAVGAFAGAPPVAVADAPRLPIIERRSLGADLKTVYAFTQL